MLPGIFKDIRPCIFKDICFQGSFATDWLERSGILAWLLCSSSYLLAASQALPGTSWWMHESHLSRSGSDDRCHSCCWNACRQWRKCCCWYCPSWRRGGGSCCGVCCSLRCSLYSPFRLCGRCCSLRCRRSLRCSLCSPFRWCCRVALGRKTPLVAWKRRAGNRFVVRCSRMGCLKVHSNRPGRLHHGICTGQSECTSSIVSNSANMLLLLVRLQLQLLLALLALVALRCLCLSVVHGRLQWLCPVRSCHWC
mmetsp:Transcript_1964/g.3798  ORF Transcript_1964/g.3798 Transcript_1964/m.3798 type:complete len:252 (+) Transcript_1964:619-1374(+)